MNSRTRVVVKSEFTTWAGPNVPHLGIGHVIGGGSSAEDEIHNVNTIQDPMRNDTHAVPCVT